jgi:hypothetical protein
MKYPDCGHVDRSNPKIYASCSRVNDDDLVILLPSIDGRIKHLTATEDDCQYINTLHEENKRNAKIAAKSIDK